MLNKLKLLMTKTNFEETSRKNNEKDKTGHFSNF